MNCPCGQTQDVAVLIPADLSCIGYSRFKSAALDKCIAPLVRALQHAGINMRSSCCGHGIGEGEITLDDGRLLIILSPEQANKYLAVVSKEWNISKCIDEASL